MRLVFKSYNKVIEKQNRDLYNQAQLTAEFIACYVSGHKLRKFEDIFAKSEPEKEIVNQDYVRALFIDYRNAWNARRKGGE